MAILRCLNNRIGLICLNSVYLYETTESGFLKVQLSVPDPKLATSQESGRDSIADEDKDTGEQGFSCANFSPCSSYFLAVSNRKALLVWQRNGPENWQLTYHRTLARKCVQVRMCATRDTVLVADRAGDVYAFQLDLPPTSPGQIVLGRLSMALDMLLGENDEFLAVSDRDEKVQVSHFPNCYNIATFCLGHTQFVSSLALMPSHPQVLVSGSGDGTIRTWCRKSGRQMHRLDLGLLWEEKTEREPAVRRLAVLFCSDLLACLLDGIPEVLLLTWDGTSMTLFQRLPLPCVPEEACFDDEGHLWLLLPSEDLVRLYARSDSQGQWELLQMPASLDNSTPWALLLKDMKHFLWEQLQGKVETMGGSSLASLYKQWFSNEDSYLEKKRQREEQAGGKRPKLSC